MIGGFRGPGDRALSLRKHPLEVAEQCDAARAPASLEGVERAGDAGDDRDVAVTGERRPGALRRTEQPERDRGLAGEQPEQLHLLEREARALRPVEHLQDAERELLVQQR